MLEQMRLDRCGKITASKLEDVLAISAEKWKVLRPTGKIYKSFDTPEAADIARDDAAERARLSEGWMVQHCPGKPLQAYEDYMSQLVADRLTKIPKTSPDTYQMQWGKDNEPHAIFAYEVATGRIIRDCEFIPAGAELQLPNFGASPDGLVGMDGCIEIKCPVISTRHLVCFKTGIPIEHHFQMEGQLIATGRDWVDFCSYDPRFVGKWQHLQLFVARYESNPDLRARIICGINALEKAVTDFIDQLPKPPEQSNA